MTIHHSGPDRLDPSENTTNKGEPPMTANARPLRTRSAKLLLFSALALLALGVFSSTGSAAPIFTGTFPNSFSIAAAGGIKLVTAETGPTITCKEVSGRGTITSITAGTFEANLASCVQGIPKCEGAKLEGSLNLVRINPTTVGVLLVPKEFLIQCGSQQYSYRGKIVAPITPVGVSTKNFTVSMAQNEPGYPQYHECEAGCGDARLEETKTGVGIWRTTAATASVALSTSVSTSINDSPYFSLYGGTFPNTFSIAAAGGIKLVTAETGPTITCKEVSGSGSITSATAGTFEANLASCVQGIPKCEGAKLEGSLNLVRINPTTVGVLLVPKEFLIQCGSQQYSYRGKIVAPITPVGVSTKNFTVSMAQNEPGYPQYHECEAGCGDARLEETKTGVGIWRTTAATASVALSTGIFTTIVK
jgi:hypothetical protein